MSLIRKISAILVCMGFFACTAPSQYASYDRKVKTLNIETPSKKTSIGILYFSDARTEMEKLGVDFLPEKRSLRLTFTKLAEEMLSKHGGFSSVSIITAYDLPDFHDAKELYKFQKTHEADYILGGEILEAKIVKVEKTPSLRYRLGVFLSRGIAPEPYEYVARVRLRGKLMSVSELKVVWEGETKSYFGQGDRDRYSKKEDIFMGAMHNALGEMLAGMSKSFSLKVKEVQ